MLNLLRTTLAVSLAAILSTSAMASDTRPADQSMRRASEITSPGDTFIPWNKGERPEPVGRGQMTDPPAQPAGGVELTLNEDWPIVCKTSIQPGEILLINKGDKTLKAGTELTVVLMPTNEVVIVVVPADIPPGTAFEAGTFEGLDIVHHPDCRLKSIAA